MREKNTKKQSNRACDLSQPGSLGRTARRQPVTLRGKSLKKTPPHRLDQHSHFIIDSGDWRKQQRQAGISLELLKLTEQQENSSTSRLPARASGAVCGGSGGGGGEERERERESENRFSALLVCAV